MGSRKVEEFPFDNGARYFAMSVLELRDGNAECSKHGRCAFDRSPPCGCFPIEEKGGTVVTLPQGRVCECGCGERPSRGKRFVRYHASRVQKHRKRAA